MAQPTVRTLAGHPYPATTDPRDQLRARIAELEQQIVTLTRENQELERALGIGDTN